MKINYEHSRDFVMKCYARW